MPISPSIPATIQTLASVIALLLALLGVQTADAREAPVEQEIQSETVLEPDEKDSGFLDGEDGGSPGNATAQEIKDDADSKSRVEESPAVDPDFHPTDELKNAPKQTQEPFSLQDDSRADSSIDTDQRYALSADTDLRESPDASSKLILTIPAKATARTLETTESWTRLRYLSFEGWHCGKDSC